MTTMATQQGVMTTEQQVRREQQAEALERARVDEDALAAEAREQGEHSDVAAADAEDEARARLPHLYTHAGDLEVELGSLLRRDPDLALTPAQIGRYNQLLRDARMAVPGSIALREDVGEIEAHEYDGARVGDVYRALHTTIVPTLHNALPEDEYDKR